MFKLIEGKTKNYKCCEGERKPENSAELGRIKQMDSFNEAWEVICDYCRQNITEVAYNTWISKIEPVKLDFVQGKAILMVPGDFHRQTL